MELLAPAGDFDTALAAFAAGADAVYCGLSDFSARAFAKNLSSDELKLLVRYAHAASRPRKVYVTFNTLVDEDDLEQAVETLSRLEEAGPDALIVQDLGIARLCRRHFPSLELHASTQLVAHNLEGVLALKELGFRRVVLARELSLAEIASIAKRCGDVELECFIHGALCYSISGLCLFGAMEKERSGNRGKCPYCCRLPYADADGGKTLAFSMKDLRLGEDALKLVEAGVASLKIEGRMKSALYVASVTKYYRQILGEEGIRDEKQGMRDEGWGMRDEMQGMRDEGWGMREGRKVSAVDLETVFSRRTTKLYFSHPPSLTSHFSSPIDPESLGHLGAEIGTVKRITKDREGLSWLRFHTVRGLERHDGLQFEAMVDGKHVGMGIVEMRQAISRRPVFEVNAGTDVEVLLPADGSPDLLQVLRPGMKIYCSMSNVVKRMFPTPSFRPSDYDGAVSVDVEVTLSADGLRASADAATVPRTHCEVNLDCALQPARNAEKTYEGVKKSFSKLGGTDYRLGKLTLRDDDKLFAPMSSLNDLRRDLVERLDGERERIRREKVERALAEDASADAPQPEAVPRKRIKIRAGQKLSSGSWDEVIVAIDAETEPSRLPDPAAISPSALRLALPVYTAEPDFNRLRSAVKRFLREGYVRWEASDLATLRMLKALGAKDLTADWTLYAFNSQALKALSELGVGRFVASPENVRENLQYLAESGFAVELLVQQSTPLFISLTEPAARPSELAVFRRNGLWVTTRPVPRTFASPAGASTRLDLSWDPD